MIRRIEISDFRVKRGQSGRTNSDLIFLFLPTVRVIKTRKCPLSHALSCLPTQFETNNCCRSKSSQPKSKTASMRAVVGYMRFCLQCPKPLPKVTSRPLYQTLRERKKERKRKRGGSLIHLDEMKKKIIYIYIYIYIIKA